MKKLLYITLFFGLSFFQCKEKKAINPTGIIEEIDGLTFSVPGIDPNNINVGKDVIIINLPENYSGGDYIKPYVRLGNGYTTNSDLVNGFSYEGKKISFLIESRASGSRLYTICVVPFHPVKLAQPAKDYQLRIVPGLAISVPISFHGTSVTVNDSGKIVEHPYITLIDKATGTVSQRFLGSISHVGGVSQFTSQFPATVVPGNYSAAIEWGSKKELLSNQISIESGPLEIRRGLWYMLPSSKYFELSGYNISGQNKYELIIQNDFVQNRKIQLTYKDAGTLTGNVPDDVPTGNYKATYLENGKVLKALENETGIEKYMGDDNFYIRNSSSQPILKMISQPSLRKNFQTQMGFQLDYFAPATNVSRTETLMAYVERQGAFPSKNDMVLTDRSTGKKYSLSHNGLGNSIFDGFVFFLTFDIPNAMPDGEYEVHVVSGDNNEVTERYSQIISIR